MSSAPALGTVTITPVSGIPEVREGDDLTAMIGLGLSASGVVLRDGDVVVVSSKIASKALGLVTDDPDKDRVVAGETDYVVAERSVPGRVTRVVRSKAGPIMAAAGVDGSNTGDRGGWLLLPHDPDGVCERLHDALTNRYGVRLGVVLSDTSARPWRLGHSDFALGAHGLRVVDDLRGAVDADGRELSVTTRAVADEIAAAADLAKGKTGAVRTTGSATDASRRCGPPWASCPAATSRSRSASPRVNPARIGSRRSGERFDSPCTDWSRERPTSDGAR